MPGKRRETRSVVGGAVMGIERSDDILCARAWDKTRARVYLRAGCPCHGEARFEDARRGSVMEQPWRLDLRERMALAARAVAGRLDAQMGGRPWFLLRGRGGFPVQVEHSSWDLGDMGGRYLESLILARRMGIEEPELAAA